MEDTLQWLLILAQTQTHIYSQSLTLTVILYSRQALQLTEAQIFQTFHLSLRGIFHPQASSCSESFLTCFLVLKKVKPLLYNFGSVCFCLFLFFVGKILQFLPTLGSISQYVCNFFSKLLIQ